MWNCTTLAKINELYLKGTLAIGSDADIVIFDPITEELLQMRKACISRFSAYEGWEQIDAEKVLLRELVLNGSAEEARKQKISWKALWTLL